MSIFGAPSHTMRELLVSDFPDLRLEEMTTITQVMPQDIVREIFVYFETYRLDANNPEDFPWYLGHICSQWRTTLLSIGLQKVCISPWFDQSFLDKKYKQIMIVVAHFLELNRDRQFDFDLRYECYHFRPYRLHKAHLFGLLAAASARWRHVALNICPSICGAALYQLKDHLPSIQSVRLRRMSCNKNRCSDDEEPPKDIFTNTPSLTHVELSLSTWDWEFVWSNLTYLKLSFEIFKYQKPLLLSLQQATNLNTLVTDSMTPFNISERITLPRLESWRVLDYRWLSYIKAPELQNLCLHGSPAHWHVRAIDINVVVSFLRESGCKLTRLTLADGPSDTLKILQYIPGLIHLNLVVEYGNIADYIESLCVPVGSELPAPRLQSLQFDTSYYNLLRGGIIDGLQKLLSLRNGQAANNGGRVERLNSLIFRKDVIRIEERLRKLCETFCVELRSPEDALHVLTEHQRVVLRVSPEQGCLFMLGEEIS